MSYTSINGSSIVVRSVCDGTRRVLVDWGINFGPEGCTTVIGAGKFCLICQKGGGGGGGGGGGEGGEGGRRGGGRGGWR
jgi:hypothetical protein